MKEEKPKDEEEIVYLKISNGHQIWIFKKPISKMKYYGVYEKPKSENVTEDKKEEHKIKWL